MYLKINQTSKWFYDDEFLNQYFQRMVLQKKVLLKAVEEK